MRILWFLGIAAGAVFIIFSEWFFQNFGRVNWAEEHLGAEGGSRLFYKLLGIIIIFISFLGISGALSGIVISIFGPLFSGLK